MVGKNMREFTGISLNYFYAIGEALVALIAWLSKDWKVLQLVVSAPAMGFIIYYWLVPESIRWLLAKDRNERAKGIVFHAAKINKVTLSDNIKDSFTEEKLILQKVVTVGFDSLRIFFN